MPGSCVCLALFAACVPAAVPADEQLHAVLAADDRRGTEEALVVLRDGLAASAVNVRAAAVRALGRLERIEFVEEIAVLSRADADPAVRLAATHALAQASSRADGGTVAGLLSAVLADESASAVRGAAAVGLGRLGYSDPAHLADVERHFLATMPTQDPVLAEGVARGLAALMRGHRDFRLQPETLALLGDLAAPGPGLVDPGELGRVAAADALLSAGQLRGEVMENAIASPIVEVRRIAARAASGAGLDAALNDRSRRVRLEALRALRGQDGDMCARYHAALEDEWLPVRLTAIDALAACADGRSTLAAISGGSWADQGWQPGAHALASLARLAPELAVERIAAAADAQPWQIRMYAARAADETGAVDVLRELATDAHPNVQHAALRGLQAHLGHAADDVFVTALESPDYQVAMAAAGALAGGSSDNLEAILDALDRITTERRETSRDPRAALLRTALELGDSTSAARLEPYLRDFDAAIAEQAAQVLTTWTGIPAIADPRPLPLAPFPSLAELREIRATRAVLALSNGDTITLGFFPFEAPTHAARFVRLGSDGYFDGLTFHRVVYNFVLQGGSPGANEFMGDGPYSRDEITARAHRRGTVGTSTRGRDTGDGQIFINLVDNLRLDFNYTIFAEVVAGEDKLDNVREDTVIESVTFTRND